MPVDDRMPVMDLDRLAEEIEPADPAGTRRAAVLIPIINRTSGAYLLFTKRADWLSRHPGQMSFPGGAREPSDDGPVSTAIREATEEVGIRPDEIEVVGRLPAIRTISDFTVSPIVSRVADRRYVPDGEEIVEVVILPVDAFLESENHHREWREGPDGTSEPVEYFEIDEYTVWGATGRLVAQLLELTTDWEHPDGPVTP